MRKKRKERKKKKRKKPPPSRFKPAGKEEREKTCSKGKKSSCSRAFFVLLSIEHERKKRTHDPSHGYVGNTFFFSSSSSSHFTRARSPYPPSLSLSRYRSSLRPFFLSRWRSLRVSGIRATILRNGSYFLTACQCFRSRSRCWYSQPVHVTVVGFLPLLRRRMINYCGRPLIP